MSGCKPTKPRRHGSLHAALSRAIDETGGLDVAAELFQRSTNWLYTAADPVVERRKKATLSYEEARVFTRAGATALAEDLALLSSGMFLAPIPNTAPAALRAALASYAKESGEALCEPIFRASDGVFDRRDAEAALKEIDEALRADECARLGGRRSRRGESGRVSAVRVLSCFKPRPTHGARRDQHSKSSPALLVERRVGCGRPSGEHGDDGLQGVEGLIAWLGGVRWQGPLRRLAADAAPHSPGAEYLLKVKGCAEGPNPERRKLSCWTPERLLLLGKLFYAGLSHELIAQAVGVSKGAISGKLDRLAGAGGAIGL